MKRIALCVGAVALGASLAAPAMGEPRPDVPLIPREVLFGNPDRAALELSPDGTMLAWLAPVNNVLNVWVAPVNDLAKAKAITHDDSRGIRQYFWAYNNQNVLYLQDVGGDEDWQLFSVDVASGANKLLTPFDSIPGPDGKPLTGPTGKKLKPTAQISQVSPKYPNEILVGLNNRDPQFHDIYRMNVKTGEMKLVQQNPGMLNGGSVAGFVTDDDFAIRFAQTSTPDGGGQLLKNDGDGKWSPFITIGLEDALTVGPIEFDKSGDTLYMTDSRGRDTAALVAVNVKTGASTVLADNPKADMSGAMIHPTEKTVQAVAFTRERREWQPLDKGTKADLAYLRTVADGDVEVISRTLDDKKWIAAYLMDDGPVRYYLYDRDAKKAAFLFTNRKGLEGLPLAKMRPVVIKSRDGMDLISYLTLPVWADSDGDARPNKPLPMVLLVHGGPWARDNWGYNSLHQLLANRGYAVLSVNYRGSTGFGKNFINAGNMEWAGKMHDDLIDGVNWAVKEKIADEGRVAIMGGSYGGYATLVGLTFTPDEFACGVDIVGPSNIVTLLNTIPPYWQPLVETFKKRVGDHTTPEGQAFLKSRSPLTFVDKIKKPLLIGQGANDPRVKQPEADQIVKAMQAKNIPVTYVLYPDEGHGFARPENRMSFFAVSEAFLAEHIGGRYQPIDDDFKGSSITVPTGADLVPGVAGALPK